jgi:hypothetical protein
MRARNRFLLIVLLCLISNFCFAQQDSFTRISARAAGLGYANATLKDGFGAFHNPASLAFVRTTELNLSFENRFGLDELSTLSAAGMVAGKWGTSALALSRFGGELFNIQRAGFSFSNEFGLASLGLRFNYDQFNIQDFGRMGVFSIDFGGMATLTSQLHFGAYIRNLNQASFSGFSEEYLPTILNLGLAYQPTTGVMLLTEIEKDIDFPANLKAGVEYVIRDILIARGGYQSRPAAPHFGIGLIQPAWQLDYALQRHLYLGYIHQFSFQIKPGELKK